MDDVGDDWLLDDWDEDAFDDDVWDVTQADDAYDDDGEEAGWTPSERPGDGGGTSMGWSAWEVGTVFALGGWLADRHAEGVGQEVRRALASAGTAEPGQARPARGALHPPPPTGYPYASAAGRLRVGAALDQGALFAEVAAARAAQRDLLVQAEGQSPSGGLLLLVVSVVPVSAGPWLWVVAEEHAGGFAAARLVPVFQPDRNAGLGVFATDHPGEAADAAAWACAREGVRLAALTVTERRTSVLERRVT